MTRRDAYRPGNRKCSGARQSTWCIMSSQKKSKRKGSDSPRKKPASKSHAGEGWVAVPGSPSWMVPRWKSDKYPAEINVLLADENPVGGAIHNNTLYATTTSLDTLELSKCVLQYPVSCVESLSLLPGPRSPPPQTGRLPPPAPGHHATLQPCHCPTCGSQEHCRRGEQWLGAQSICNNCHSMAGDCGVQVVACCLSGAGWLVPLSRGEKGRV